MSGEADVVAGAQALFGSRLRGLFLFGSRVTGRPRPDSDLDVGVWLEPPLRRQTDWVPWARRFEAHEPVLDPRFFASASLERPPGWLLEALAGDVNILADPSGLLDARFADLRRDVRAGRHRRRVFMGLPYYETRPV